MPIGRKRCCIHLQVSAVSVFDVGDYDWIKEKMEDLIACCEETVQAVGQAQWGTEDDWEVRIWLIHTGGLLNDLGNHYEYERSNHGCSS